MEEAGRFQSDEESDKAAKFYEQALLLVDCCKIPEAIKLLEKAIEINPDSEIYKETLAFFQMNAQCYSGHLQKDKQGLSYASVARPKSSTDNEKQKSSSTEWNVKKTKEKENPSVKTPWSPSVSSSYYSDPYEQATIENPWASFVNSNYRKKKTDSSPIDGLSEIDVPLMNGSHTEGQSSKHQVLEDLDGTFSSTLDTPMCDNGSSFDYEQENHVDDLADHFGYKNGEYPEGLYTYSDEHDENLETRFLEEFCTARETAMDDWAKYYDMLRSGLREEVPSGRSDILHQDLPKTHQYSDSLDEIDESRNFIHRNHLGKDQSSSGKPSPMDKSKVCSKCGHLKEGRTLPSSPTKNRIHFVNGACISSSSFAHCTCNKQNKRYSEGQPSKSPLSSSQKEFYRNLQHYFGNGKVKSKKTASEEEEESSLKKSSGDLHPNSTTACNSHDTSISSDYTKETPIVRSNQNVTESTEDSTEGGIQNSNETSKEHFSHEVKKEGNMFAPKAEKSSLNAEGVKKDKKSLGKEGFQQTSYKPKSRVDDKSKSKTKASKTEHVKNSKEGASHRVDSHRQTRPKVGVKSRVSHRMKAGDTTRTVPVSDVKEKTSYNQRTGGTAQAEIDFSNLLYSLYFTGISLLSKSGQAFKSIIYYVLVLLVLLFGFLIYCVWFAVCWLCRKVLQYTAIDRLLAHAKNKVSALYEWFKKRKERKKVSAESQTYDLPKNGDAAVMHMLQNKDNDPYSVLGVPRDATDDDIRKQYRKLAVLIHPDKNTHPQADEAFKTLANAFDILSDPEKRFNYDAEEAWKRRAEEREGRFGPASPEQFFADLGRKMQEMQNYLHCNACDGKHRRYSTDRFILTARFCSRCNTRHAAKEGDLWAESSFLGYKLHFYACMEGEVFDVTEWAACQGIGSYRVEPNPHTVHLKLKTRQTHPSGFNSRSEEKEFENFMRAFFGQFPSERERFQGTSKPQKRRRKKKH